MSQNALAASSWITWGTDKRLKGRLIFRGTQTSWRIQLTGTWINTSAVSASREEFLILYSALVRLHLRDHIVSNWKTWTYARVSPMECHRDGQGAAAKDAWEAKGIGFAQPEEEKAQGRPQCCPTVKVTVRGQRVDRPDVDNNSARGNRYKVICGKFQFDMRKNLPDLIEHALGRRSDQMTTRGPFQPRFFCVRSVSMCH